MVSDREIDEIVASAEGDIDRDLLTETGAGGFFSSGYFSTKPLVQRFQPRERPNFVFENRKRGIDIEEGTRTENISPEDDFRAAIILTNQRILCVFGEQNRDRVVTISYDTIDKVEVSKGIRRDKIVVKAEGRTYHLYTRKSANSDAGSAYIRYRSERTAEMTTGAGGTVSTDAVAGVEDSTEGIAPSDSTESSSESMTDAHSDLAGNANAEDDSASSAESVHVEDEQNSSTDRTSSSSGSKASPFEDQQIEASSGGTEDSDITTESGVEETDGPDTETGVEETEGLEREPVGYAWSADDDLPPWKSNESGADRVAASSSLSNTDEGALDAAVDQLIDSMTEDSREASQSNDESTDEQHERQEGSNDSPKDTDSTADAASSTDVEDRSDSTETVEDDIEHEGETDELAESRGEENDETGLECEEDVEHDESGDGEDESSVAPGTITAPAVGDADSWTTETDPELPTIERVEVLDKEASGFVEAAVERFDNDGELPDHETGIRVHADLCRARRALTQDAGDVGTELDSALKVLETKLANNTDTLAHDGTRTWSSVDVTFVVHDQDNDPIESATIEVAERDVAEHATTDEDGRVEISVTANIDTFDITCHHPEYKSITGTVPVVRDDIVDIQLATDPLYSSATHTEDSDRPKDEGRPTTTDNGSEVGSDPGDRESSESDDSEPEDEPTREALLAELSRIDREWSQDIDRVLLHSVSDYHPKAFENTFGSLDAAIATAQDFNQWNTPEKNGETPSDADATAEESESVEDKLDRAIREAGLDEDGPDDPPADPEQSSPREWSSHQEDLLTELRRLDDEWSKDVDRRLLYTVGEYSPDEYETEFGGLEKALVAAGIDDGSEGEVPDSSTEEDDGSEGEANQVADDSDRESSHREALLTELRRLDDEWSRDVDRRLLYTVGEYSPAEYEAEFGSLDTALAAAGIDETLESEREDSMDTTSNSRASDSKGDDSGGNASGREDTGNLHRSGYTKAEVEAEIQRLTDKLGRVPKVSEMQEYGKMSPTPAYRHWGSWSNALEAAGVTGQDDVDIVDSSEIASDETGESHLSDPSLPPNELAELYDFFGHFESMVDEVADKLENEAGDTTDAWYDTVYDYWAGDGTSDAPSLGAQQSKRNDFSIAKYRETYGDGNRVQMFHHVETASFPESQCVKVDQMNVSFDSSTAHVPVAPVSGERLPVLVETQEELERALSLLDEFPSQPTADHEPSEGRDTHENIPPEGRVDSLEVSVKDYERNPGSRRDATVKVKMPDGGELDFQLWSKHDIDADWETGATYRIEQARHKVWNSSTGVGRSLSSTRDCIVTRIDGVTDTGNGDRATDKTNGEIRSSEDDEDSSLLDSIEDEFNW
ncbi:homing endonuclease associated repeat-containing protein [Haloarchaeobius amylolyticus]|uniref:homing endonuclease associated repeat-containing protein n=1 Tax=Haloarchaeobius amylolyticus TaxID=1198296 RepID=UPI002270890A|nr:PH domain-containing protein [Haloarchaeobius amylolyticus]